MKGSALYRADAIELTALYLGLKAEADLGAARRALQRGVDSPAQQQTFAHGVQLLQQADRLLASHPTHRLEPWLDFARAHGTSDAEKNCYESDARLIVSRWGGGIVDYSTRVWSGLIRDYYIPRLQAERDAVRAGQSLDFDAWERKWAAARGVSPVQPLAAPVAAAQEFVREAKLWRTPDLTDGALLWEIGQIGPQWSEKTWDVSPHIQRAGTVEATFRYASGRHRLDISHVELLRDGIVVASDEHAGSTGEVHQNNTYRLPLAPYVPGHYTLRAQVRADGDDSNDQISVAVR